MSKWHNWLFRKKKCLTTEQIHELINKEMIKSFQNGNTDILINTPNQYVFHLTTLQNELDILNSNINNSNNLSVIDLKDCRNSLINSYNLSNDTNLLILKYENIVSNSNEKSIQFEVYESNNGTKLNLSYCSSLSYDKYIPSKLKEDTIKLFEELKSHGYNLFDKNDKFYNDICATYKSSKWTDVLLSDRYNDYFIPNGLQCQKNCEYSDYSFDSRFLKCKCNIIEQENMEMNEPEKLSAKFIITSFVNTLKYSNYKVLKCKYIVFQKRTLYENKGSIITMIYFFVIFFFYFILFQRIFLYKKWNSKNT